jgi:pyrophosphatase PpaX
MTRYHTLLFDLDGTLIDSVQLILDSYHHTLRVHGIPARSDDDWLRGVGTPLRVQFAEWDDGSGMIEALVATYREYNLANHDSMVTVYDGIAEMLQAVRAAGHRTALVTSKNRQGALRGLDLTGLTPYIEELVCADDVVNPKPHPEPVEMALRLLGVGPERAVFFGDSVHDMHSGRAAGVKTAAVLWGPFGRADLEPSNPDHWIERPQEILQLIGA